MSFIEKGQNIVKAVEKWQQRRSLSKLCGDNLVKMRVFDDQSDSRGRSISIYDGASEGYKSDFGVDKGQKILEELSSVPKGTRVDLIISPKYEDETQPEIVKLKI